MEINAGLLLKFYDKFQQKDQHVVRNAQSNFKVNLPLFIENSQLLPEDISLIAPIRICTWTSSKHSLTEYC
jgi:hypothetical protein